MSLLTNLLSATIKTVLVPIAVIKDAVDVATGEAPKATRSLIAGAMDEAKEGFTRGIEGDLL